MSEIKWEKDVKRFQKQFLHTINVVRNYLEQNYITIKLLVLSLDLGLTEYVMSRTKWKTLLHVWNDPSNNVFIQRISYGIILTLMNWFVRNHELNLIEQIQDEMNKSSRSGENVPEVNLLYRKCGYGLLRSEWYNFIGIIGVQTSLSSSLFCS